MSISTEWFSLLFEHVHLFPSASYTLLSYRRDCRSWSALVSFESRVG